MSSMFFGAFPGGHMVSPKRPKQHLKHWGGGGRGWQVKSPLFLQLRPSFDPKIKWWIFKILMHVELFPNKVEWFNFTTPKRALNSKDANRGEWSKVCLYCTKCDRSQHATCNIGCSPQVFWEKVLHVSHLKCYLV